jgi:uncharacterized protein
MSFLPPIDLNELERRCRCAALLACGDAAHDALHLERVVANARWLAPAVEANWQVVMPAIWLHDCVHVPKDSPDRARASRLCAAHAATLLRQFDYPEVLLPAVVHAIEAHSWSAAIAPETLEAAVVQDADRLDSIGAAGVARCLMLAAEMKRPLYALPDPWCEHRQPDDKVSAVDHFHTKLLHLAPTFRTTAGRAEAARRTAYLRGFLEQLAHEAGVPIALCTVAEAT